MKLALIQQSNTAEIAENIKKLEQNIRSFASQGAELIEKKLYFCK